MRYFTGVAVIVAVLLLASPAAFAQTDRLETIAPGVEWAPLSLSDALAQGIARNRLVVVYRYVPGSANHAWMEEYAWRNPTLAAYIRWHAIAIRIPDRCTGFAVFKGWKKMYGQECLRSPQANAEHMLPSLLTKGRKIPAPPDRCPGAVAVLLQCDHALERIKATDPVWWMLHEEKNPPPQPPPMPPPFYLEDEEAVGPEGSELDAAPIDLWDRLESARRAVRLGDYHRATRLYTWLWERAAAVDPAFAPARRWFIGGEIADLASTHRPARERFGHIRDARGSRLLWAEYDDLVEWSVLGSIVQDDELTIEWFHMFINTDAEAAMLPRADKVVYDLMLARTRFSDPWELGADPVERIARIAARATGPRPPAIPTDDWERLRGFLATYLVEEASRLHCACLSRGRDEDARRIADSLLSVDPSAAARRALVTCALVAGQPRPMHATILGDADPDLAARLRAALETQPAPSPGSSPR